MATKKYTVWPNGTVQEPFDVTENTWFYAARGNFSFYGEGLSHEINVPTSMIRKALALVDSRKRKKK